MHVCVISFKPCWRGPDGAWYSSGGFPIQMRALASLFDRMTLLITEVPPEPGGTALPVARVVPMPTPIGDDARRKLSVLVRLPTYLQIMARHARGVDVVHTPVPGDLALLGMLVGAAYRRRLLVRYGGSWDATPETTLMNRVTRQLMRQLAGGRNVMLATGAGTTSPAPHMHWMFTTAVSTEEVRTVRPDLARPPATPLRLIYAGRLSPEKGVDDLIAALDTAHRERTDDRPTPVLTILGTGTEREKLEALARRTSCPDAITFRGQVDRVELVRELLQSDVCVLPSRTESFCKARLDAMLCGVPVVTTPVGFGREFTGAEGERGWIVAPRNVAALAGRLSHLPRQARAIDWPAIRARCRRFAETYTVESWTQAIGEICARTWGVTLVDGKLRS